MRRSAVPHRPATATALCLLVLLLLPAAAAAAAGRHTARRPATFRPRIGFAMGIIPHRGAFDPATGTATKVAYHGGQVMRGVRIHTVFWAPPGHRFDGSPGAGAPGYEPLVTQFLSDAARGGPAGEDVFSALTQYSDQSGPGSEAFSFDPGAGTTDLTAPFPAPADQCASPSGTATCVTDGQLQQQLDQLISSRAPHDRGLGNLWIVLLAPDVDECILPGSCASNAFAGYHSVFDRGHGTTVYVAVPDPLIEQTPPQGSDPQGNPEGEAALDVIAHELVESITDPYGTGWIDPTGLEAGDKCETGPQEGTPAGYAPNGAPYNQLLGGHQYLLQEMWSNELDGCVQGSTATRGVPDLPSISLRQYSPAISGGMGHPGRAPVELSLMRGAVDVARVSTRTRADGSWGPIRLRSPDGAVHALGDDRDVLLVNYGFGAGAPPPEAISTGSGGDPFAEAGFTGWADLDGGLSLSAHRVQIAPCGQTGVLTLRIGRHLTEPPAQLCSTQTDVATVAAGPIGPGTPVFLSSLDNRAVLPGLTPDGALVKLTVAGPEPGAAPSDPRSGGGGLPVCDADLRTRQLSCSGLVPRTRYRVAGRSARADAVGGLRLSGLALHRGAVLALVNRAGRHVTTLHVARLRVDITGNQTRLSGGSCQPGEFYGAPSSGPSPIEQLLGLSAPPTGLACPLSGRARGLGTATIAQSDERSGGLTVTTVPRIRFTAPLQDETLYGRFIASAQSGLPGPHGTVSAQGTPIALWITPAGSPRTVFSAANVDSARGVAVAALAAGTYVAHWRLRDANGDTRTLSTRFTEAS